MSKQSITMLQKPGPLHVRILAALAIALAGGVERLTIRELAIACKVNAGGITGATSGMVKCGNRHWIVERFTGQCGGDDRQWAITPEGMAALVKLSIGEIDYEPN